MQLFRVLPSIETEEIREGTLGDILENTPEGVFIVIDTEHNKIWIYSGPKAPLPEQLIARSLANEYRAVLRLFFKLDDPFGVNHNIFEKIKEKKLSGGKCEAIKRTPEEIEQQEPESEENRTGLLKSMADAVELSRAREICVHKGVIEKVALKKLRRTLESIETPPYLERELILIEGKIFTPRTEPGSIIPKSTESTTKLVQTGTLQDGFFFLEGRSCRLIAEKGRVVGVEVFIPKEAYETVNLDVPVLYEDRLMYSRDIDLLKRSFKMPDHLPLIDDDAGK